MQQRKSKRILIYFFLLILLGSINNINLNNLKLYNIENIDILGLNNYESQLIYEDIKKLNLGNIFLIKSILLTKEIDSNSFVHSYHIFKKYPSTLVLSIKKTKFLAKINKEGKIYLVGENGKLLKNNNSNKLLPFIFGNPAVEEILNFKAILDKSKFSYDEIKNLYYFPSKRWDIELKNNIVIKLSKEYISEDLNDVFDFLNNENFKNINLFDTRVKNQIIINE